MKNKTTYFRLLFTIILSVIWFNLFASDFRLNGTYVTETNREKITINSDSFIYTKESEGHQPVIDRILLIAKLKFIDKQFAEINNFEFPAREAIRTSKVNQSFDYAYSSDSLIIQITEKLNDFQFYFSVYDIASGEYNLEHIPITSDPMVIRTHITNEIIIYIENNKANSDFYGTSYNLLSFSYPLKIKSGVNYVSLDIPLLTDEYFNQLNVQGEYIRFKGNHIYWRGKDFKKS